MTDHETPQQTAERLAVEKYNIITIDGLTTGHESRNAYVSGYMNRDAELARQCNCGLNGADDCYKPGADDAIARRRLGYDSD